MSRPENILKRLEAADREHQKESAGTFLARSLRFVAGALLALFTLDVLLHLESRWRVFLGLLFILGIIILCAAAWYIAFIRRNRLEHIARFLEMRDPALGSKLINLLQLQQQEHDSRVTPLTRTLAHQAVESYSEELRKMPLERLAWTGILRKHLKRTAWAMLGVVALLGVFHRVSLVEFARFLDPYGDHPPYSFTRLEFVTPGPQGTNVLYGKGFLVRVKAQGHHPKDLFLTVMPGGQTSNAFTLPMFDKGNVGFDQMVDNIKTDLVIVAHTKNKASISKQRHIEVILTPKLDAAFVQVAPPPYTGLKAEEKSYTFKPVQALQGSEIRFRFKSNRPLKEGAIEVAGGDITPKRVIMKPTGENEVSGSLVAEGSGRLSFFITDISGLHSQEVWEGALTVTHDLAPEIRIVEPERDALVAMDFKLKAQLEATDDYGLRSIRIHRGLNGVYSAPLIKTLEPPSREGLATLDLSFAELGIQPNDVISLYAEAMDNAPEPHLARSQTVRLLVISVEAYNDYLRQQSDIADAEAKYAELLADLQELIEKQKELGSAAEQLRKEAANSRPAEREKAVQRLDELLGKQSELNHKLNQHANRMANFVRDNPLYDVEAEFKELLNQQADNIRNSATANQSIGDDLARQSSSPGGRQVSPDMAAQFKKASDEQIERLSGAKAAGEEQVAKVLQDMSLMQELLKDFNQFESLYRTQEELAAQAQAYDRPGQLSREDQLALKEIGAAQKQVADLLAELRDRLEEDATAAEKLFPKAARSAKDLAVAMDDLRLQPLAVQATDQMLAGNGEQSYRGAERLRSEMASLFSQCQNGNCPSGDELDSYLALQRGLNAGKSFAQMAQSMKFGKAGRLGMGMAMGQGTSGSGYSMVNASFPALMGNEKFAREGSATGKQPAQAGKGNARGSEKHLSAQTDPPDAIKGANPANRQSGVVNSEVGIEEYSDLVDRYFEAITTKKTQ